MSEKDYNPNMHTIEHLLNGTISRMFGCGRAFTTHIEKKKSKIDYHFDRNLTEEELSVVQNTVNEIILKNIPVTIEMMPMNLARQKFDLSRLPEGVEGDLRIVNIGEFDACPCIGSHVQNTSEIGGLLKIISSDHNPETGVMRIRFKIDKQQ